MKTKDHKSSLIVDIGEHQSTFAYQIGNRIKHSRQIKTGVKTIDNAIVELLRKSFNLKIGERTSRTVWIELANLVPQQNETQMLIRGRNIESKELQEICVAGSQINKIIFDTIEAIINEIQEVTKQVLKENATNKIECEILLRGQGRRLNGLAFVIAQKTSLPIVVSN